MRVSCSEICSQLLLLYCYLHFQLWGAGQSEGLVGRYSTISCLHTCCTTVKEAKAGFSDQQFHLKPEVI